MYTAYPLVAAVTLTLVSVSWANVDTEHKCLKKMPGTQCDLSVTYQRKKAVCGKEVTGSVANAPTLSCSKSLAGTDVLVLMIDHDLPFSGLADKGYLHWAAKGKVNTDGSIKINSQAKGGEYQKPYPPPGPAHRYDTMVFAFEKTKKVSVLDSTGNNRIDKLCDFMKRNGLGYPKAAMAFKRS